MVEILISEISQSKSDLVICGYTTVTHENYIKSQCKKAFLKGKKEISNYIIKNYHPGYINSPCNKLYRKDLIKHYFDENQSLGEDLLFNIDYLKSVNSINCINDCLYYYRRENNESLSLRYRSDLFITAEMLHNKLISFLKEGSGDRDEGIGYDLINIFLFKNTINYLVGLINKSEEKLSFKINKINEVCGHNRFREAMINIKKMPLKYKIIRIFIKYHMTVSIFVTLKLYFFKKSYI